MGLMSMGRLILSAFGVGGGKNVITDTLGAFRPNAEREAERTANFQNASLQQYAAEFAHQRKGWFDRFIDGINRLPRPMLALGTLALFISAMYNPVWFGERMQGLALVPDQLWWLLGAIITFYFGARERMKDRSAASSVEQVRNVVNSVREIRALDDDNDPTRDDPVVDNPALTDWRANKELKS